MSSALSAAWVALVLTQAAAWVGASALAGSPRLFAERLPRIGTVALMVAGVLAAAGATAVAVTLSGANWAFAAEKLALAAPLGLVSSLLAAVAGLRAARDPSRRPLFLAASVSAALGAVLGLIAAFLVGPIVSWPAVVMMTLLWLSGSGITLALVLGARKPVIGSTAGAVVLSLLLLLVFTVFGPVGLAGASAHHLATSPGTGTATAVTDLREDSSAEPAQRFALEARHQEVLLPDGSSTDAVTFGSLPGPELVVTEGELVEVTLTNRDVEDGVTLHWHGLDVPNGEDGVAGVTQDAVAPGETFVYRFVPHQAGTFWYHTHQDALQGVRRGLYGSIVVLPAGDRQAGIQATALLHTISGDLLVGDDLVLEVPADDGEEVRLRIGNTDQVPHRIVLDADAHILALDGTDLGDPAPLPAGMVLSIPAGGRADVGVTAAGTTTVAVQGERASGIVVGGAGNPAELSFAGPSFDLLSAGSGPMPAWSDGPFDVRGQQVLDRLIRVTSGVPRLADTINGGVFPTIDPLVVDQGDAAEITVVNRSTVVHPMHLHGHRMLVLSRDGVAPDGALWLDTIDVAPGEVWRIAFVADNPGIWMDHCHNLEHAAVGMVMHVAYTGVQSPFELGGEHGNAPE